jgi:hypothetical protein
MEPESRPNPYVDALLRCRPPPEPMPEDRATPLVLFHRAKLAGFDDRQAGILATYLEASAVVRVRELVEAGCALTRQR